MHRMPGMVAVPTVEEQMNDRTEHQKPVRERAEKVRSVFFPEEKQSDGEKEAGAQPNGRGRRFFVAGVAALRGDRVPASHVAIRSQLCRRGPRGYRCESLPREPGRARRGS